MLELAAPDIPLRGSQLIQSLGADYRVSPATESSNHTNRVPPWNLLQLPIRPPPAVSPAGGELTYEELVNTLALASAQSSDSLRAIAEFCGRHNLAEVRKIQVPWKELLQRSTLPLALAVKFNEGPLAEAFSSLSPKQIKLFLAEAWAAVPGNDISIQPFNSSARRLESSMRVISFNICGSRLLSPPSRQYRERLGSIQEYLKESAGDVIALQEVWSRRAWKAAASIPGTTIIRGDRFPGLIGNSGLTTVSRWPAIRARLHTFSYKSGIEIFCRKGALFSAHILPDGQELQIWNVHLASGPEGLNHLLATDKQAAETRVRQFEELSSWIAKAEKPGVPVLIIGDFNTSQDLSFLGRDIYRSRYPLALRESVGTAIFDGFTFDPIRNPMASGRLPGPERLDRLLLRGVAAERLSAAACARNDRTCLLSDHYAVEFDLMIG